MARASRVVRGGLGDYSDAEASAVLLRYGGVLAAEVKRMTPRAAYHGLTSEDLTSIAQVAALSAHRSWRPERGRSRANWVGQVVRWRLRDAVADPGAAETPHQNLGGEAPHENFGGAPDAFGAATRVPQPDARLDAEARAAIFEATIGQLSPRRRTIVACYLNGETFGQIAETLGVCHQYVAREYKLALGEVRKIVEISGETWEE